MSNPKPKLREKDTKVEDSMNRLFKTDTIHAVKATSHVIPNKPPKVQTSYGSKRAKGLSKYSRRNDKRDGSSSRRSASNGDTSDEFQESPPTVKRARRSNSDRRQPSNPPDAIPTLFVGETLSINELSSAKANRAKSKADVEEKHKLFDDLSRQSSQLESTDDANSNQHGSPRYVCPYCNEVFPKGEMTDRLKRALKMIKQKDEAYAEQEIEHRMKRVTGKHKELLKKQMKVKRPVDSLEQHFFCRLHRAELVVRKEGRAKNYPEEIRFNDIQSRLERLRGELEKIIRQEKKSQFRDIALKAYEEMGKNKARSTLGVMARVDNIMTGYYGSKGSGVIQDALSTMFLHTGMLTNAMTKPQLPLEYLQQVLVPEAALVLIRQDLYNADAKKRPRARFPTSEELAQYNEKAEQVLKDSTEFGKLVHMAENEIIADFSDQSLKKISLSDDESSSSSSSEEDSDDSDFQGK
ncbi:hypothetical protein RO3G_09472 [Lichtheimia corymbifera JMRC:FSU:9682]|uniref:Restriction of telomere capping protein 4 n=1 Tax=Lichtheimia corymbifera JMRC:FSU:9682 TaxID=1263082 RepID=A0A068RHW8_9FUNG|nr:hypothetical protein RO3G_09472 [Lichtheimia corymbifera JMRC:FSU:9682]